MMMRPKTILRNYRYVAICFLLFFVLIVGLTSVSYAHDADKVHGGDDPDGITDLAIKAKINAGVDDVFKTEVGDWIPEKHEEIVNTGWLQIRQG